jgi:hypothetical protein
MAAQLPAYQLNWKLGVDDLMIVSVGTGSFRSTIDPRQASRLSAIGLAVRSLAGMISESQQLVLTLMTYLGQSPVPWPINSEIGELGGLIAQTGQLFRYLRYDVKLEQPWLKEHLGETIAPAALERLRQMDDPQGMTKHNELGGKAAALQIKREHLERTAPA